MATKKKIERVIIDTYFPTNEAFETWKKGYIDFQKEMDEDFEIPNDTDLYEEYYRDVEMWMDDEIANLNKEIDGVIVAFADLGLWNGRKKGARCFGSKINSIIDNCGCDYIKLYADRYNILGKMSHHDGTHYLIYRIAPTHEIAEEIEYRASVGILTEDYFKRKTKSLRKHVAKIYGW